MVGFVQDGWSEVREKVKFIVSLDDVEQQPQGNAEKFSEVDYGPVGMWRVILTGVCIDCQTVREGSILYTDTPQDLFPNSIRIHLFIISTFGFW